MNNEFIPYEEALALKELGFNEPCFRCYDNTKLQDFINFRTIAFTSGLVQNENLSGGLISAPLYQQAFEFFRENFDLHASFGLYQSRKDDKNFDYEIINHDQTVSIHEDEFKTYKDAQLACLKRLIQTEFLFPVITSL